MVESGVFAKDIIFTIKQITGNNLSCNLKKLHKYFRGYAFNQ